MPSPRRTKSGSPSASRRRCNVWLIADCVTARRLAARVTFRSSRSTSSATSRFTSMRERLESMVEA